ncbi:MAG: hypothetical protein IJZ63_04665, partial [Clostridia bacterium]|nr:hypothetical protein [Clostridia bacterium]
MSYDSEFLIKIKYSGITVFDNKKSEKKQKNKYKKQSKPKKKSAKTKKDNFFIRTYKQKGLMGTIKYFSAILKIVLKKLMWLLKKFK